MKSVRFNSLATTCLAALLAIGLAACGGSSTKKTEAELEAERLAALQAECTAASGRWNDDNTCTSAADLAAEEALANAKMTLATAQAAVSAAVTDAEQLAAQQGVKAAADAVLALDAADAGAMAAAAAATSAIATLEAEIADAKAREEAAARAAKMLADAKDALTAAQAEVSAATTDMEELTAQKAVAAAAEAVLALDATDAGATVAATAAANAITRLQAAIDASDNTQAIADAKTDLTAKDTVLTAAKSAAEMAKGALATANANLDTAIAGITALGADATAVQVAAANTAYLTAVTAQTAAQTASTAAMAAVDEATTAYKAAYEDLKTLDPTAVELMEAKEKIAQLEKDAQAAADKAKADLETLQTKIETATQQLAALQKQIEDAAKAAKEQKEEEERKAMAAKGKVLKSALGLGSPLTTALTSTKLTVTPTATSAPNPVLGAVAISLKKGDSAGSLGAWAGANYAHKNAATDVSNSAVVYNNQAAAKTKVFSAALSSNLSDTGGRSGTYDLGNSADPNIDGADFPTSGSKTYDGAQRFPGTYMGASGTYECASGCVATYSSAGISLTGTDWKFTPATGAMASEKDGTYLYFGWWLRNDGDGEPTHAAAFTGKVGTGTTTIANNPGSIAGTATYSGHAAGKFAIYNPLDKSGDGGDFTADATLEATFGSTADGGGLTGTIDNFMTNGKAVPWSVSLFRRTWDANTAGVTLGYNNPDTPSVDESARGTVWSINGNSAPASGNWTATMYDEKQADGSDVATTVTGTFSSGFGTTHSMIGAFGATKTAD